MKLMSDGANGKDLIGSLFEQEKLIKKLFEEDEDEANKSLEALRRAFGPDVNREEKIRYKFKMLLKSLLPDYSKCAIFLAD